MFSKISNAFLVITISLLVILSCTPSEEIVEPPKGENINHCSGIPTVTYKGKTYNTVQIGNQCWLKENLDVGNYISRGRTSTYGYDNGYQTDNNIIEKWCYENDETNCDTLGALYQWDEAMQYTENEGAQGICPDGWHIPSMSDFKTLGQEVGESAIALKDTSILLLLHGEATNTSGFSALMGGDNYVTSGHYNRKNEQAFFWTSTLSDQYTTVPQWVSLWWSGDSIYYEDWENRNSGHSIRCILNDDTNRPPLPPSNPNPQDGATQVSVTTSLSWTCSDPDGDPLTYDIYFGTSNPPHLVASNQTNAIYNPGTLEDSTKYYWRIIAKDDHGNSTGGLVWSFTTITHGGGDENKPPIAPYNPTPPDSTTVVSIYQSLSWSCSDPDGDPLTYDVYLGTSNNPTTLVSSNQTGKTYSPGTLNEWTKYYWKIVAKDDHDHSTSGPVWEFTTKGSSGSGSVCLGATTTVAYEGKTYNTVLIGDQCWLKENLNVGTRINSNAPGDDQTDNGVIDKYCYDNNEANCDTYGGLYQWNEAMQYVTTEGAKGICPDGWHIPTYSEFETLNDAVTDDGNSLKALGEGSDFGAGTNTSGFSALLAGNREEEGGYYVPGYSAFFWSSTAYSTSTSIRQHLNNIDENIDLLIDIKELGFSIRCLED